MASEQVRISRPAAIDPPHVDRRLSVQGSHFVIFGKSRDLAKSKRIQDKRCRLAKIPIPADQRDSLQEELEALGITASSVFPDLEALGQELSLFWKLRHKKVKSGSTMSATVRRQNLLDKSAIDLREDLAHLG